MDSSRVLAAVLFCLAFGLLLRPYGSGIRKEWHRNPLLEDDATKSYDQHFYMEDALGYVTGSSTLGIERSRMPLYPWLLALVHDPVLGTRIALAKENIATLEKEPLDPEALKAGPAAANVIAGLAAANVIAEQAAANVMTELAITKVEAKLAAANEELHAAQRRLVEGYMRFNVGLSVFALLVIALICRRYLGSIWALWLTGVVALHVFLFKAFLIQPEVLYYGCSFALFMGMLSALVKPPSSPWTMLGLGLLGGGTYLLKGTALPMIGLFLALYFTRVVWSALRGFRSRLPRCVNWGRAGLGGMFLLGFLNVTGFYMINSYHWYGSPFYDPNSRYYLWADSPEEMYALQRTGLAYGKPRLTARNLADKDVIPFLKKWVPDDTRRRRLEDLVRAKDVILTGEWDILPGFKNYCASHTISEAGRRLWDGLYEEWDHNYDHPDGYGKYVIALAILAGALGAWRWMDAGSEGRKKLWERYGWAVLLAAGSIGVNLLLYGWWAAVSSRNRFFLTQYLPLIFCCIWIIHRSFRSARRIAVSRRWTLLGGRVLGFGPEMLLLVVLWIWFFRDDFNLRHVHMVQ